MNAQLPKVLALLFVAPLVVSCQMFESQVERRERVIADAVEACRQLDRQSSREQREESKALSQQAVEYVAKVNTVGFDESMLASFGIYLRSIDMDDCDVLNAHLRLGIPEVVRSMKEEAERMEWERLAKEEVEKLKQDCSSAGGEWVQTHWDGSEQYGYVTRCLKSDPPQGDADWEDWLLPYEISTTYSRETNSMIEFERVPLQDAIEVAP